jgi:hypothetical protein
MGTIHERDMYVLARNDDDDDAASHYPIRWAYDTSDPFAIKMIFTYTAYGEVAWRFARDLLASAVVSTKPVGYGDISAWYRDDVIHMILDSYEGRAIITMERRPVLRFVKSIYDLVPEGFELNFVDIDEQIEMLRTSLS